MTTVRPSTDRTAKARFYRDKARNVYERRESIYAMPPEMFTPLLDLYPDGPFFENQRRDQQAMHLCFLAAMVEAGDA